jgi:D-threo-aldose 1-dehydrogenase
MTPKQPAIDAIAGGSLGHTKLRVSRLGFGTTALGNIMRETTDAEASAAVEAAWSAGLRYFDTAPQYGQGLAEQRLGAALRARPRGEYVVSTKIGKLLRPTADGRPPDGLFIKGGAFEIVFDYSHDGTLRSLESSLARLGLDRVDVLLIHDINRRYHGEQVHERLTEALGGAAKALSRLRDEGVIGAFGPAFNDIDILTRFVTEADVDCLMLPRGYSLLNQQAAPELLPLCLRRNVSVLIASPFESGILATGAGPGATYLYGPADEEVRARVGRIEAVCRAYGVPLAAAALQFPAHHPAVSSVVVGMRSAAEVTANLQFMAQTIPDDFWRALEQDGLVGARAV